MTTKIHLNKNELQAVASMINVTAPKDHVTALSMVQLTANIDGSLSLVATNRMVIGEQTFTPHYPVEVDEPIRSCYRLTFSKRSKPLSLRERL